MKCPTKNCQGEIKVFCSIKGRPFLQKYKLITYFCPICNWRNTKVFEISNLEFEIELENRKLTNNNDF